MALLVCALAGPVLADTAPPNQQPLAELIQLAQERNDLALDRLRQQKAALTTGVDYATQLQFLKLYRQTLSNAGRLVDAYATDTEIIRLATSQADPANIAIGRLGVVNMLLEQNKPSDALKELQAIEAAYPRLSNPEYTVGAQRLLGETYNALGQYDRAHKHYVAAIEMAARHPELWNPQEAMCRILAARLFINTRHPEKALEALTELSKTTLTGQQRAWLEFTIGIALVASGKTEPGLKVFALASSLAREHGLRSLEAQILGNISDAHLREKQYVSAEKAARRAMVLSEEVQDANAIWMALANLGFALAGQGKMNEGLPHMDKVVAALRAGGSVADLANMLGEKSQALEAAGMYKEALETLRERETINNKLALHERSKAIEALQEQFNSEQRSAQIASLTRDNRLKDAELGNRTLRLAVTSLGFILALLISGIVYVMYRKSLRTSQQLKVIATEFEHDSLHDPLTDLCNRRSFSERMSARTAGGRQRRALDGSHDCFTLLDIDHFKRINDEHGHAVGDAVLVEVAKRLSQAVRESDTVIRWGGEEFLVYSHEVGAALHPAFLQRILSSVAQAPVVLENGLVLQVTMSAGSVALPFGGLSETVFDWQQAVALADRALYQGKQQGRNRGYIAEGVFPAFAADAPPAAIAQACETGELEMQLVLPLAGAAA